MMAFSMAPLISAETTRKTNVADEAPMTLEDIYRTYAPMVYRRVLRFYGPHDAEEIVHEIFMKLIEQGDRLNDKRSPASWLHRVTTNHCLNRVRDAKRRRELLHEGWAPFERLRKARQEPAFERVLLDEIWRALPEHLAEIAIYAYVDGMTQAEIAEIYDVSDRTISNRLKEIARRAEEIADAVQTPRGTKS